MEKYGNGLQQGWVAGFGAGAGRSRVFLAPWRRSRSSLKKNEEPEQEPLRKKSQEPEPEPEKNLPAPQPWKKVIRRYGNH